MDYFFFGLLKWHFKSFSNGYNMLIRCGGKPNNIHSLNIVQ